MSLYVIGLIIIFNGIFVGLWVYHPSPSYFYWSLSVLIFLIEIEVFLLWFYYSSSNKKIVIILGLIVIIFTIISSFVIFSSYGLEPKNYWSEQFSQFNRKFDEFTVPDINSEERDRGMCIYLAIKFARLDSNRTLNIFNMFQPEDKISISIFIDQDDFLVFKLVDKLGNICRLAVPDSNYHYNELMSLQCEYGFISDFSYSRIFVNGILKKQEKYNFKITPDITNSIKESKYDIIFGKNFNTPNGLDFIIKKFLIYYATMNKSGREQMFKHFYEEYGIGKNN